MVPTAKMIPASRPLSTEEHGMIEWLLGHGEADASAYLSQLSHTSVASHCDCGCPTIGLTVSGNAPRIAHPSGIIADVRAVAPEGNDVGIMPRASDGFLEELEVYPIGETPPKFSLPLIESITLLPPNPNHLTNR